LSLIRIIVIISICSIGLDSIYARADEPTDKSDWVVFPLKKKSLVPKTQQSENNELQEQPQAPPPKPITPVKEKDTTESQSTEPDNAKSNSAKAVGAVEEIEKNMKINQNLMLELTQSLKNSSDIECMRPARSELNNPHQKSKSLMIILNPVNKEQQ
jgi:hypothetical protein